jgi:hypothetical protein
MAESAGKEARMESWTELCARLNAETGRLAWPELAHHFARGAVVKVAPGLDLVEVAARMVRDDQAAIMAWAESGTVARATDADALAWQAANTGFWAVVAAPWVLVQEAGVRH